MPRSGLFFLAAGDRAEAKERHAPILQPVHRPHAVRPVATSAAQEMRWAVALLAWGALAGAAALVAEGAGGFSVEGRARAAWQGVVQPVPPCGYGGRAVVAQQPYDSLWEFRSDSPRACAEVCAGVRDCQAWSRGPDGACRLLSEALPLTDSSSSWAGYAAAPFHPPGAPQCLPLFREG